MDLLKILGSTKKVGLLTELSSVKAEYDKVAQAVSDARERGYGIVVPTVDELNLEEPEIMKQGGRYGVRLKASAPSLHIIRADIETTVSPIVGNEKQSEDMVNYLLQEFELSLIHIYAALHRCKLSCQAPKALCSFCEQGGS